MAPPIQLGIGLSLARAGGPGLDPDAAAYIAAVETADGQALESGVRKAINNFVVGCKSDGIWDSIKASCILAGARTLSGALTPLVGTAPTNNNFVSGDYNRETGLIGDASTKYLDSNYSFLTALTDNKHLAVFASSADFPTTTAIAYAGSSISASAKTQILVSDTNNGKLLTRCSDGSSIESTGNLNANGLIGVSRSGSSSYSQRGNATNETVVSTSSTGDENNIHLFKRNNSISDLYSSARLSFYSIGESLDLAALDTRVSTLMTDIATAIP